MIFFRERSPVQSERELEISTGFQRGDRWAFEAAAKEHFSYLVNFIAKLLNDREKALELAQESFFLACRAHEQLNPQKGLTPWLFQIARNLAYKEFNARKKNAAVSLEESMEDTGWEMPETKPNPREESQHKETWNRIHRAIQKIKPKYRDIVILRIIMGVPSEKVSQLLKIPVATVNTNTHRALKQLRLMCGQEGLNEDEVFL